MKKMRLTSKYLSKYQPYTIQDIAEKCDRSTRTITSWIGNGLSPIDPTSKPLLFKGEEIKRFIAQTKQRKKCKLKKHEFWCPKCHKPTTAKDKSIQIIQNRRHALCKICGTKINKFIGKSMHKERAP